MARILELLTVNVAVHDLDGTAALFRGMGLTPHPPNRMPEPPAEITDVSIPLGDRGAISLISPTAGSSPVAPFLAKRGEGVYSIAVRVDDLAGAMREWPDVAWVLAEPYRFPPGTPAVDTLPERLLANWIKPKSLHGVMLEVFEFQGELRAWGHGAEKEATR